MELDVLKQNLLTMASHAETAVKQNPGVLSLVDELVVPNLGQLSEADSARLERAIAAARTCYSPRVIAADEVTARQSCAHE